MWDYRGGGNAGGSQSVQAFFDVQGKLRGPREGLHFCATCGKAENGASGLYVDKKPPNHVGVAPQYATVSQHGSSTAHRFGPRLRFLTFFLRSYQLGAWGSSILDKNCWLVSGGPCLGRCLDHLSPFMSSLGPLALERRKDLGGESIRCLSSMSPWPFGSRQSHSRKSNVLHY